MTAPARAWRRIPMLIPQGDPGAVMQAAAALRAGLVVAIPTDTVYGFAAAVDQRRAIDRLYALKGRPKAKAIPVLLSDLADLERVSPALSGTALVLVDRFWPGGLTLVLPALPHVPDGLTSFASDGRRTIAVRLPDHDFARRIIAAAGGMLAVTSANHSGDEPALDAQEVMKLGDNAPDLVIDGGRSHHQVPSTVVLALSSELSILREGAISMSDIERSIEGVVGALAPGKPHAHPTCDLRMIQTGQRPAPDATSDSR